MRVLLRLAGRFGRWARRHHHAAYLVFGPRDDADDVAIEPSTLTIDQVDAATRPVLWFDEEHGYHGFGGTAFCVRYLAANLVVTARHVLGSDQPTGFRIARETQGDIEFVQPTNLYWYNDGPPTAPGAWDHAADVAIGVLDCEIPGAFSADIFDTVSPRKGDHLAILGYAKARNEMVYHADLEDSPRGELARRRGNPNLSFWTQDALLGLCDDDRGDIRELRQVSLTNLGDVADLDGMSGSPVFRYEPGSPGCHLAGMLVRGDAKARRAYFVDGRSLAGYILRVAFKNEEVMRDFIAAVPAEFRDEVAARVQFLWGPIPPDDRGELEAARAKLVANLIAPYSKDE